MILFLVNDCLEQLRSTLEFHLFVRERGNNGKRQCKHDKSNVNVNKTHAYFNDCDVIMNEHEHELKCKTKNKKNVQRWAKYGLTYPL